MADKITYLSEHKKKKIPNVPNVPNVPNREVEETIESNARKASAIASLDADVTVLEAILDTVDAYAEHYATSNESLVATLKTTAKNLATQILMRLLKHLTSDYNFVQEKDIDYYNYLTSFLKHIKIHGEYPL